MKIGATAEILAAAIVAATGCGHVSKSPEYTAMWSEDPARATRFEQIAPSVVVTSNPNLVQGCKFLGNVRSERHATRSTFDVQFKTAMLEGDTVYSNDFGAGREIIAEAYRCGSAPVKAPPPSRRFSADEIRVTSEEVAVGKCLRIGPVAAAIPFNPGGGFTHWSTAAAREETANRGGDALLVEPPPPGSSRGSGAAFRCFGIGAETPTPVLQHSVVPPEFVHLTMNPKEVEGCREVGPSHARIAINSDGQITVGSSQVVRELTSQNGGNTILIVPLSNLTAEGTGYECRR